MTWYAKAGWNIEDLGLTDGVQVHGLDASPGRTSDAHEKADAVVLQELRRSGVRAIFSENDLWTSFWVLLYWDQIFAKLPSSYEPLFGESFPTQGQDIPQDLFRGEFYASHRGLYERRRAELAALDLGEELRLAVGTSRKYWTRLLEGSARYDDRVLVDTARELPNEGVLRVLDRLWRDYKAYRRGLPDLLILEPEPRLVEVKGPNDRLSKDQAAWLRYLSSECGLPTEVLTIGWSKRKLANLHKLLEEQSTPAVSDIEAQSRVSCHWQGTGVERELDAVLAKHTAAATAPMGVFWTDHIKTLRHVPEARLACALQHLPLPAAFREAVVALRAMVRARRKSRLDWRPELAMLYRVAAESSLLWDTPHIDGIGPAFNVAATIPRETLDSLVYPYSQIGYEKLSSLNQTDRKWLVEAWREPERHQSAQVFHKGLWSSAVAESRRLMRVREEQSARDWKQLLASVEEPEATVRGADGAASDGAGGRRGCGLVLLAATVVVLTAFLAAGL